MGGKSIKIFIGNQCMRRKGNSPNKANVMLKIYYTKRRV